MKELECLNADAKLHQIKENFDIRASSVYDTRRARHKLEAYQRKQMNPVAGTVKRKMVTNTKNIQLEEAVWMWYCQEWTVGIQIQSVADCLAKFGYC